MYIAELLKILPKDIWVSIQIDNEIYRGQLTNVSVNPFRMEKVSYMFPSTDNGEPILIIKLEEE